MMLSLVIGLGLISIAVALVFIGIPNKAGQHPRFLRFVPSLVLYPPVILVCFAMGMAEIVSSLFDISG
jgi:hypothetical protein